MRVALAQMRSVPLDKSSNMAAAARLVADAGTAGADLVVFPELFLTGYFTRQRTHELAEPADGPSLKALGAHARAHRIAVALGFPEADRTSDAVYNAVCLISATGQLMGCYRKMHLYGEEPRYYSAGDRPVVADVAGCPVGLLICYDLEFPESARLAALRGARILVVSSANMSPFEPHQDAYLRSRALENHAFVVIANRVGAEEDVQFFGGSAACDPLGRVCCRAGGEEALLVADLDLSLIQESRRQFDYFSSRRPGMYGPLVRASTPARSS